MKNWIELIKAIPRPFIIVTGWLFFLLATATDIEIPELLKFIISAVTVEYFGERAIKRFKEK